MNYQDYKGARDMTWKILLDCGIDRLPVKVSSICQALGVHLRTYTQGYDLLKKYQLGKNIRDNDGFLFWADDKPIIFYNGFRTPGRQRFTVAHELGHLVLGHKGKLINREPAPTDNPLETAANVFAARLLAPACVLRGLKVDSAAQIEYLCNISHTAAQFRMERLKRLYDRDEQFMRERGRSCFFLSPLEWKVYQQFEPYIKAQISSSTI